MYLIRPLHTPAKWLIGASYRSSALIKVFAEGSLGAHGVAALIDARRGGVQAVAGPAAVHPRLNVFGTANVQRDPGQQVRCRYVGGSDGNGRQDPHPGIPPTPGTGSAGAGRRGQSRLDGAGNRLGAPCQGTRRIWVGARGGHGGVALWVLWRLDSHRRRRHALEQAAIQLNSASSAWRARNRRRRPEWRGCTP